MARIYPDNPDFVQASLEISPDLTKSQRALLADAVLYHAVHEADVQDDMPTDVAELASPFRNDETALTTRIQLPQDYVDSFAESEDDDIIEIPDAPKLTLSPSNIQGAQKLESKFKPEISNEILVRQVQEGDVTKVDQLVKQNMAHIRQLADRVYANRPEGASDAIGVEDLIQEGIVALWKSVDGYKADAGASFMTYARRGMVKAMRTQLQPFSGKIFSTPKSSFAEGYAVDNERTRAKESSAVNRLERAMRMPAALSLDTVAVDVEDRYERQYGRYVVNSGRTNLTSLTTFIPDGDPATIAESKLTKAELKQLTDVLEDRELEILGRRGTVDGPQLTNVEIGKKLGISAGRVGQIAAKARIKAEARQLTRENFSTDPNDFARSQYGEVPTADLVASHAKLGKKMQMDLEVSKKDAGGMSSFAATLEMIDYLSTVNTLWAHKQVRGLSKRIATIPQTYKGIYDLKSGFEQATDPLQEGLVTGVAGDPLELAALRRKVTSFIAHPSSEAPVRDYVTKKIDTTMGKPKTISEVILSGELYNKCRALSQVEGSSWKLVAEVLASYIDGLDRYSNPHELQP